MDDALYVNAGDDYDTTFYPSTEPAVTEEDKEKRGNIAASLPIMGDVAKWFEDQINNCPNIQNIETKQLTINGTKYSRSVSIEAQVLAYQLLQDLLVEKYQEFKDFKDEE